jgi:hypothetical protein
VFAKGHRNKYLKDLVVYHEVLQVSPWQWLFWNLRFVQLPEFLRRYPSLRKPLLWKGPFVAVDHLLFYLALIAVIGALTLNPWISLLAIPYLLRIAILPGRGLSPRAWLFAPLRMIFPVSRQLLVTLFLVWGSIRARNLIL